MEKYYQKSRNMKCRMRGPNIYLIGVLEEDNRGNGGKEYSE